MPPITSSRPGARATEIDTPGSDKPRARSRAANASTSGVAPIIAVDPATRAQRLLQQRLDLRADPCIRVADPRDLGADVQWGVERRAMRIGHDDAALLGNQRTTDVVGMTRQRRRQPAALQH